MKRICSNGWPMPCFTPTLRCGPSSDVLSRSTLERSALWAHGISGDLPIVLARIDETEDLEIIRQLLRAHEYWRMKQLSADVVIINEKPPSYSQDLQSSLEALVRGSQLRLSPDTGSARGSIVLLRADLVSAAGAVLLAKRCAGGAAQPPRHVVRAGHSVAARPKVWNLRPCGHRVPGKRQDVPLPQPDLEFFNGLGGFAEEGREYVTVVGEGLRTPAAVDQRDCQSFVRLSRFGIGLRLHLVAQQPRKPAHALVQRSRDRSARRSHLHPRRQHG